MMLVITIAEIVPKIPEHLLRQIKLDIYQIFETTNCIT